MRLVEYPSNTEVSRAFRNRAIDGAALTLDEALLLAQDGFGLGVVLVMDISHGGDVILGRAEMRTVRDLVGRRVAVDTGTVAAYVLARALTLNGLERSNVKVVHVDYSEHAAAFQAGRVDAVVNGEPLRSELLASGASLLFDSTAIPGEIVDVLAIRSDYLEAHGAIVTGLLRAWFRAIDYLNANPEDAAARMAVREHITAERFLKSLEVLRHPGARREPEAPGGPGPTACPVRAQAHGGHARGAAPAGPDRGRCVVRARPARGPRAMTALPSLKRTVPLLLLAFAGILSAVDLLYHIPRAERTATNRARERLFQDLSGLQGSVEYLVLKGDLEGARREVTVLGSNPECEIAMLLDDTGLVIAATRRAFLGQPARRPWRCSMPAWPRRPRGNAAPTWP